MELYLDVRSGTPIYDQICTQLKRHIMNGTLREDEALPSIRGLAKELRVSVITTKRAYDELEKDGFIYTAAGRGCFVAPQNAALLREEHLKQIEAQLAEIRKLAAVCGVDDDEVVRMYRLTGEEGL